MTWVKRGSRAPAKTTFTYTKRPWKTTILTSQDVIGTYLKTVIGPLPVAWEQTMRRRSPGGVNPHSDTLSSTASPRDKGMVSPRTETVLDSALADQNYWRKGGRNG